MGKKSVAPCRRVYEITFGSEITLERRLDERSSSTASENPVPEENDENQHPKQLKTYKTI